MNKFAKPNNDITDRDIAFGPNVLSQWMPAQIDIPKEFFDANNKWYDFISDWFFAGLTSRPQAKEGIDTFKALAHIRVVMSSFEPKHEYKIAACAYLASLWFEEE